MIHFEHVRHVSKRNYVPTNYKISNGNIMVENRHKFSDKIKKIPSEGGRGSRSSSQVLPLN